MLNEHDSLGIENYGEWYLELKKEQIGEKEMENIENFLNYFLENNKIPEFEGKTKKIQFINYGRVQLVFVLNLNDTKLYTLLVNQPATKEGTGLTEYNNLLLLNKKHKEVIKPIYYFVNPNDLQKELYITPYYYQSRCIGVEYKDWGIWIPEPKYHFKIFNKEERKIINICMVALMIKFYDDKEKKGICKWRLDGGDFMLEKGFEDNEINKKNILNKIKLIAARLIIDINFDDYVEKMKKELSGNINDNEEMFIIGKKLRCPLSMEEIEEGIKFGKIIKNEIK